MYVLALLIDAKLGARSGSHVIEHCPKLSGGRYEEPQLFFYWILRLSPFLSYVFFCPPLQGCEARNCGWLSRYCIGAQRVFRTILSHICRSETMRTNQTLWRRVCMHVWYIHTCTYYQQIKYMYFFNNGCLSFHSTDIYLSRERLVQYRCSTKLWKIPDIWRLSCTLVAADM